MRGPNRFNAEPAHLLLEDTQPRSSLRAWTFLARALLTQGNIMSDKPDLHHAVVNQDASDRFRDQLHSTNRDVETGGIHLKPGTKPAHVDYITHGPADQHPTIVIQGQDGLPTMIIDQHSPHQQRPNKQK
jgi:hypothetical protein